MNTLHRVFWLLTLCAFLSGCSGYRLAALPGDDPAAAPADSTEAAGDAVDVVAVGSMVRVTTTAGEVHKGKVLRLTPEALVLDLGEVGAVGRGTVLSREEIATVELSGARPMTKGFVVIVSLATALVVWIIIDCATHDYSYGGS